MKINGEGLNLIKEFEGLKLTPYLCPSSICTIGYGTTYYPNGKKVTLSDKPINEKMAIEYLEKDIINFEKGVDKLVTSYINENQFSALVCLVYNIGLDNFKLSTILKRVNNNPYDSTIRDAFMMWNKSKGKIISGLLTRRAKEADLYFS